MSFLLWWWREGKGQRTVCDFAPELDILLGIYHNLLLPVNSNDLRRTIRIARMINQPPNSPNPSSAKKKKKKENKKTPRTQDSPSSSHPPPNPHQS